MLPYKEVVHSAPVPHNFEGILVADIGGTNSNFGVFKQNGDTVNFILSLHFKSKEIKNFTQIVVDILTYLKKTYNITVTHALFAAAGVISQQRDTTKPTNASFIIDTHDIKQKTSIRCMLLANDFEVIGYGLSMLKPDTLVQVNSGAPRERGNKGIIGAGTGLGKCLLYWDVHKKRYMPLASEGGHADFAAQDQLEFDLIQFIQKYEQRTCTVSWEDVLSGTGIQRMYRFFQARNKKSPSNVELQINGGPHPDEIFNSRNADEHSWHTFELYTKLYARCAKNYALDVLALGGIYIAGGIAAKNLPMFELPCFENEFINCGKQQALLKQVPVYVITDYNVSLYGAVQYLLIEDMCKK